MVRGIRGAMLALLAGTAVGWTQHPSALDAQTIVDHARRKALDYTKSLPDFVCTEVVQRYFEFRQLGEWRPSDELTVKLSFYQDKEDHQLLAIDGRPTAKDFDSVGGATGVGEFGATLVSIFATKSETAFHWESWKTVHSRRVAVYSYVVSPAKSTYMLSTGSANAPEKAIVGYHGAIEIDAQTGEVLHLTYRADHIPRYLTVNYTLSTLDYDFADVGGRPYLLPARSQTILMGPKVGARNDIVFRGYNKFSADSTIVFGSGK
jgi:hypothetical protein